MSEARFTFGTSVRKPLKSLHKQGMKSLACALTQIGGHEGVTIDEQMKDVIDRMRDNPVKDKMESTNKIFVLIHYYQNNFLPFAKSFFEEYLK